MDDDLLCGFYAKGEGLLLRLTLILHLVEWAEGQELVNIKLVSARTLEMAIRFFEVYLKPMWKRITIGFSMSAKDKGIEKMARWIKEDKLERVTKRQIKRKKLEGIEGRRRHGKCIEWAYRKQLAR